MSKPKSSASGRGKPRRRFPSSAGFKAIPRAEGGAPAFGLMRQRLKRHRSLDRQAKIPRHCTRRIVIKALPAGFQGGPQMARQIFCGREADALGSAAKSCGRKPLPENRVGHSARNSPRKTFNLRENCREGRRTPRSGKNVGAGRRAGGRQQPDFHYNSVPQGRRLRRKPHRLRGRLGVKIRLLELEEVEMTKLFLPKKRNAQ